MLSLRYNSLSIYMQLGIYVFNSQLLAVGKALGYRCTLLLINTTESRNPKKI